MCVCGHLGMFPVARWQAAVVAMDARRGSLKLSLNLNESVQMKMTFQFCNDEIK